MYRKKNRTAMRTAVIGQKVSFFVEADENDNMYYDWS
jgi:hypothetical protein